MMKQTVELRMKMKILSLSINNRNKINNSRLKKKILFKKKINSQGKIFSNKKIKNLKGRMQMKKILINNFNLQRKR